MKKEIISGIYAIENIVDGNKYVGRAVNINKRINGHIRKLNTNSHANNYLQNAWHKYGGENFKFWTIEKYPRDQKLLALMEIYFISYYDSFCEDGGGYNLTRGGDGGLGYIPSEATKKLLSEACSGEKNGNYGNRHSDRSKKLMSEANLGKVLSEETRRLMSVARLGIHLSEKTRERISKSKLEKHFHPSEKTRKLMREIRLGAHHTEESKALMSKARSGKNNIRFGKKLPNASSQYFGVYRTTTKKYVYWTCIIGKKYLGHFKIEIDAAKAYDKYIIENNIDHPLNFPEDYDK
jgi:group I intron endonuclease